MIAALRQLSEGAARLTSCLRSIRERANPVIEVGHEPCYLYQIHPNARNL